jgi:hypothetical protein
VRPLREHSTSACMQYYSGCVGDSLSSDVNAGTCNCPNSAVLSGGGGCCTGDFCNAEIPSQCNATAGTQTTSTPTPTPTSTTSLQCYDNIVANGGTSCSTYTYTQSGQQAVAPIVPCTASTSCFCYLYHGVSTPGTPFLELVR